MSLDDLRRLKGAAKSSGVDKLNSWAYKLGEDLEQYVDEPGSASANRNYRAATIGFEDLTPGEEETTEATYNRDQVEEACKIDLNFLAALAMPTVFQFDFPSVLVTAWHLLVEGALSTVKLFPQLALGIPRGHAKTTLVKLFILYCILFTKKKFILVICSTVANAENIIADVADMLNEPNIMATFGDWRAYREVNRQDLKKFSYRGRDIVLGAIGSEGSIRGLNVNHVRPDVMIFEDVQTKECSESQQQSETLERWMIGTAMKAKSPYGCNFVFVGNMYPGTNSILKKLKVNPQWVKFVQGAILSDGSALWPELHSIDDLIAELDNDISMGHPEIFFSEVMNDTEAGINNRVDLSKIKAWPWSVVDRPQGKFIVVDPANNKVNGDDVGIGLFEVYDGVPALRELIQEKLSPGNTIRRSLLMALENNVRIIAIESTAFQYTLLYWFEEVVKQLGIEGIEAVDIYTGMVSKNGRINDMLKSLTAGEIIIHDSVKSRVAHQIANFNPMKRDNTDGILDLLSYSTKVLEIYSNQVYVEESLYLQDVLSAKTVEFNSPF
jgi:hypothetical protein